MAPSNDVMELWFRYEQIAMHFNELLIQFRLQLMAGIGAFGTVAGYLISEKVTDRQEQRKLRAGVSGFLTLLIFIAAILDLGYYNQLLQGAVSELIAFEAKHPEIHMSTQIELMVEPWGTYSVRAAYGVLVGAGIAFSMWSALRARRFRGA